MPSTPSPGPSQPAIAAAHGPHAASGTAVAAPTATDVEAQLDRRRRAVAERWAFDEEIVLVAAGEPIPIPGRGDITYPYKPHSEFYYLTDRVRPGGVLAFDPADGWTQFVRPSSKEELLWFGGVGDERELVGLPVDGLADWLAARRGRPVAWLGQPPADAGGDGALQRRARLALNHVRRQKDGVELERIRRAEEATAAGHRHAAGLIADGISERELQIELEATFLRHGADGVGYDTIVGTGTNSGVLHFHPSSRRLRRGEVVLIDAGAEYRGYVSDVTRTYPVSGRWSREQADLRDVVRSAELTAIEACRPGVEWRDVHGAAARVIGEGLVALGLLRGEVESLVESGAVRLFFPHGVGHMVGLGCRDAGEALPGREPPATGHPPLRVDLPLLAGHVVTVEPGVYFVPAILDDPDARERHRRRVDWDRVDALRGFGGIRIEDNVLITDGGCEVLTSEIPVV